MVKNDKSDIEAKDLQKKLKYPTDEQLFSIPSNRTPRFLGAYTYDKLPEDASSRDIVQIRIPLENGRKLCDGYLNEVKDRDLIIMTKNMAGYYMEQKMILMIIGIIHISYA